MSATLDTEVLDLSIVNAGPSVAGQGFTTALIAGPASMTARTQTFASKAAVALALTAGDISSAMAAAMNAAFDHDKEIRQIKAGRVDISVAQVTTVTVGGAADGNYTITIGTTDYTHAASGSTTSAIATALAALVDADPTVSASPSGSDVVITSLKKGVAFTVTLASPSSDMTQVATTANVSIADELTALLAADSDWIAVHIADTTPDPDDVELVDAWAWSNARMFLQQVGDTAFKDGTTGHVGETVDNTTGFTTRLYYHDTASEWVVFAFVCGRLTVSPDVRSVSYSNTRMAGFTASTLTDTEVANLKANNIGYCLNLFGKPTMSSGPMAAGGTLRPDNVLSILWLQARIGEGWADLAYRYANVLKRKIPYTDKGFGIPASVPRKYLELGARPDRNHFEPGSTRLIVTPKAQIASEDRDALRVPIEIAFVPQGSAEAFKLRGYAFDDVAALDAVFAP